MIIDNINQNNIELEISERQNMAVINDMFQTVSGIGPIQYIYDYWYWFRHDTKVHNYLGSLGVTTLYAVRRDRSWVETHIENPKSRYYKPVVNRHLDSAYLPPDWDEVVAFTSNNTKLVLAKNMGYGRVIINSVPALMKQQPATVEPKVKRPKYTQCQNSTFNGVAVFKCWDGKHWHLIDYAGKGQ